MNPVIIETFRKQNPSTVVPLESDKEFWGRVRERKANSKSLKVRKLRVRHIESDPQPKAKKPKVAAVQRVCVYPGCFSTEITRDHIVPQWVYKSYPVDQIDFPRNLGAKNYQDLCEKHNGLKAGHIDCATEVGRRFWTKFKEAIERELAKPTYEESLPGNTL